MNQSFLALGVRADLARALADLQITEPTPIQRQVVPAALAGGNLAGQSATGTGKTFAYLLPLLQRLDAADPATQAVVLAPTYELAMQIYRQAQLLLAGAASPLTAAALIGGANIARQIEKLKRPPQLAVGSANRIWELAQKRKLRLAGVRTLVLDEADRMLDEQNLAQTTALARRLPSGCQTWLFSATLRPRTLEKAKLFGGPFTVLRVGEAAAPAPLLAHFSFIADFRDKIETLRKLTRALDIRRGLVFVNRGAAVAAVVDKLRFHKIKAAGLEGHLGKTARQKALDDFAKGKVTLLVASDLAARGLDIADIDCVVNLDLPEDAQAYLHRVGRTGRAGKSGVAATIAAPREMEKLREFARVLRVEFQAKRLRDGRAVDVFTRPRR